MSTEIKRIVKDCEPDIQKLIGKDTRIIVAERKNNSIGSNVFAKSSFSRVVAEIKESQKCNKGNGCKSCEIMNLKKNVILWKNNETLRKTVKLDFRRDCLTECAIYTYMYVTFVWTMIAFTLAKQLTVVEKEQTVIELTLTSAATKSLPCPNIYIRTTLSTLLGNCLILARVL